LPYRKRFVDDGSSRLPTIESMLVNRASAEEYCRAPASFSPITESRKSDWYPNARAPAAVAPVSLVTALPNGSNVVNVSTAAPDVDSSAATSWCPLVTACSTVPARSTPTIWPSAPRSTPVVVELVPCCATSMDEPSYPIDVGPLAPVRDWMRPGRHGRN